MKKLSLPFILVLPLLCLMLCLVGCSDSDDDSSSSSDSSSDYLKLELLSYTGTTSATYRVNFNLVNYYVMENPVTLTFGFYGNDGVGGTITRKMNWNTGNRGYCDFTITNTDLWRTAFEIGTKEPTYARVSLDVYKSGNNVIASQKWTSNQAACYLRPDEEE